MFYKRFKYYKPHIMKKKLLLIGALVLSIGLFWTFSAEKRKSTTKNLTVKKVKKKKKTQEERMLFSIEREKHELAFQVNPLTGKIPAKDKLEEYNSSLKEISKIQKRTTSSSYVSRGPSNLGGRTRALVVDVSDATSNTIIAGGVSSGVFRTTNGGTNWTKVSSNSDIHNVTAIAQDPRAGSQNIWYYATGERLGNSASLGGFHFGQGVWKSIDGGLNWNQISVTSSNLVSFDSRLDLISAIKVNPVSGDLMIAGYRTIYRYDGTNLTVELEQAGGTGNGVTDVVVNSTGRVYATIGGAEVQNGVWTSPTGNGSWTRIAQNGTPANWASTGRTVLGIAPSNNDVVYALYTNGAANGNIQADLWKYNLASNTWTNFSGKLPDEPGGNSNGNDPFAVQGGYDLVVSVKPDNENFVVIGGTNVYKIADITTDAMFTRIGGYLNNSGYALYNIGGIQHHSDIHVLAFDPNNSSILFSGTDGGIHKTDPTVASVAWTSLNNNYQTYQYYHVAMDPDSGKDVVVGGAQDNGTTIGGTDAGRPDKTSMNSIFGGDGVAVGVGRDSNGNLITYQGSQSGNFYRRDNSGYTEMKPTGSTSQFVTYFYLDPDNNNALYYASNSVLYKTSDAENTGTTTASGWVSLGSIFPSFEDFKVFATTRGTYNTESSYLFIGGDKGGIFRQKDPQNATNLSDVVIITPPEATTVDGTIVSGLAVHPTNPDILLAVYSNYGIKNIFLTKNATAAAPTWTLVERNLNIHSIRSTAITQVGSETIYFVGTARGLYSSTDPTTKDWDIEGADKMGLAVVSSLVYRPSDKKLLIGTHGNGMFETTVEGTLSTNSYTKNSLGLSLYPNPVVEKIKLKSNLLEANTSISYEIYDLSGKSVKRGVVTNQEINVTNLTSGIYIVNVKSQNKQQSLKFVKK